MRDQLLAWVDANEGDLRSLLATAVQGGEYAIAAQLATCGQVLSELRRLARASVRRTGDLMSTPDQPSDQVLEQPLASNAAPEALDPQAQMLLGVENGFPHFFREGDRLVKVAWSRNSSSAYEHKAGRSVLNAVVKSLKQASKTGSAVNVDELGKVALSEGGSPIPSYQVYLCIAWLKSEGVVTQHGRQGYSIGDRRNFANRVDEAWNRLRVR